MKSGLTQKIEQNISENFKLYMLSLLFLCTGIVIGIYNVKYLNNIDRNDLSHYLNTFYQTVSTKDINYTSVFIEAMKNNIPVICAVWFLGLTIVGLPIVLIIDIIKGYALGFSFSLMVKSFGLNGVLISVLGIIPQNAVYIPCLLFVSVFAMNFSLMILKERYRQRLMSSLWSRVASYTGTFLIVIFIMFFGFLFETYATPNILKLVIHSIGGI